MSLWLNLSRVELRRAWAVKRGLELALSRGPVPAAYFDAIAGNPEEAAELEYRTNAARQDAQLKAKIGWQNCP